MTSVGTTVGEAPAATRTRRGLRVPSSAVVAWVSIAALAVVRAGSAEERDPYWEARAGIENLSGAPLARPDTWSWAGVGGDWYQNSPGWNDLLGLSWLAGGWWGLFLLGFLAVFALLAGLYVTGRRLGAHPLAALAAVVLAYVGVLPMISARATVGVQLLLLVGLWLPAVWRPRVPRHGAVVNGLVAFGAGAVVACAGNWVHLSFLAMGPALAACWAVYWLLSDWPGHLGGRLTDRVRWALALGGALGVVVGTLAGPYDLATALARSAATQQACAGLVVEWMSPFSWTVLSHWSTALHWVPAALIGLASGVLVVRWLVRQARGGRLDNRAALIASMATVSLPLLLAGMVMSRFLGAFYLVFAPVIALGISAAARRAARWARALPETHPAKETAERWTGSRSWRIVLTIVGVMLSPGVLLLGPVAHAVPPELDAITALPHGCRLFTSAAIAAPVVLVRPDVTVWFDGRADYYGRDRLVEGADYYEGREATAAPAGATCVILPSSPDYPATAAAVVKMTADPSWTLLGTYGDLGVWVAR